MKYLPDIIKLGKNFNIAGRCVTIALKLSVLYTDKDAPFTLLKAVEKSGPDAGTGCLCLDLPDVDAGLLLVRAYESDDYAADYAYCRFEPFTRKYLHDVFKEARVTILKEWELNNPNWPDAYTKAGIANPRWLVKTTAGMIVIGCGKFTEDNLDGVDKTFIDWSDLKVEVYTGDDNVRTRCHTTTPVDVLKAVFKKYGRTACAPEPVQANPPKPPEAENPLPSDSPEVLPDAPREPRFKPSQFPPLQLRVLHHLASKLASKQDDNWHTLPDGVAVTTLHALERKGVIEKQYAPGMENSTQVFPYNSKSYVWRLRPFWRTL